MYRITRCRKYGIYCSYTIPFLSRFFMKMKLKHRKKTTRGQQATKMLLHGLPDMETRTLLQELKANGLKSMQFFKMTRHDKSQKYRDQLYLARYLVHLEKKSTCLKDLHTIRSLCYMVEKWETYKLAHRDVTQCSDCLMFGHGTKNCHMTKRCNKCDNTQNSSTCELMEEADPMCVYCTP